MTQGHDDHDDHQHHTHGHGRHAHSHAPANFGRAFAIGIGLNLLYVGGEVVYGLLAHSMALLADAGHNAGDILSLAAAWIAQRLSRARPTARFTYGLRASSILAALTNAMTLLLVTGAIAAGAISRLFAPAPVVGLTVVVVAAIGIAINGGTALLFMSGRKDDLNVRAAFAHMATDALVAAGVVVSGLAIMSTGWSVIDPLASLAICAAIVASTWSLLTDSVGFAMDAVPPGIDRDAVEHTLANLPGVSAVQDLHIWGMSTTETALTAHLVTPSALPDDQLLDDAAELLRLRHRIAHTTLQVRRRHHQCALVPVAHTEMH